MEKERTSDSAPQPVSRVRTLMLKAYCSTRDDFLRGQKLIRELRGRGDWLTMMLHAGQISMANDGREERDASARFYRGFGDWLQWPMYRAAYHPELPWIDNQPGPLISR
ncbi:hypothetical protein EMIT043CA1_70061 [Pseudomonas brassicacearum]